MFKILESLKKSPSYIASGERALLRQLGRQDLRRVKRWFENINLVGFAFGVQGDEGMLRKIADDYYRDLFWWQKNVFAIDTLDGTCIGFVKYSIREDHEKHAKVGIMIGEPAYLSGGYGTEAMRLLVAYLFERERLDRIELDTATFNLRAQRSFAKCGFSTVGTFSEINFRDGRAVEKVWMTLRRSEYEALVRAEAEAQTTGPVRETTV